MEKKKIEFENIGIPIVLKKPDNFLIVTETLTRIGIASRKTKTLYQSCNILHKRGEYRIVHFLELFLLDGKLANFNNDDFRRRNTVAKLLHQWKLCTILDMESVLLTVPVENIKIVPYSEKQNWSLVSKYTIGGKQ